MDVLDFDEYHHYCKLCEDHHHHQDRHAIIFTVCDSDV
jgi:hypothetical protein